MSSAPIKQNNSALEELSAHLAEEMAQVDALIAENLKSQSDLAQKIAQHLVSSGGKRLRPMLVLAAFHLAHETDAAQNENSIRMAAAVEMIHTATLLHDDVVDDNARRRGQPTARMLWGNQASILVGDFLLGRAFEIMVAASKASAQFDALQVLSRAAAIIAEGEVMQLTADDDSQMDEAHILKIIAAKTASLFAAAAETGAILARCSDQKRAALADYGQNLGMAFQLMDDALDYDGTLSRLGKQIGGDFREGKVTLPMIVCWQHAGSAEREFWRNAISAPETTKPADFKKACKLMERHGALAATRDHALDYAQRARASLVMFPDNVWRRGFEDMADFAISRDF